jgi:aminopeptidase N
VNDSSDVVKGNAQIKIACKKPVVSFALNLTSKNQKGSGMTVSSIKSSGKPVEYVHSENLITITLPKESQVGDTISVEIAYRGKPEDGLIIGKNKFGERTFFGDNWPDRGRHWLPSIDHPSDKAPVDFVIVAPNHYQVVATGRMIEESDLPFGRKLTHWKEQTPVAVKVMAVGIARFAVQYNHAPGGVPLSTWVYPQNRQEGFNDFAVTVPVLRFFQHYIGPYTFAKLAHVQSKTRWGGLENAGNIFYTESAVTGKNLHEGLIAHETAHQWFGNAATENDWQHVWLSEGFATYMTALYFESTYGKQRLDKEMRDDRTLVIAYDKKDPRPIVDNAMMDINKVLSTLTYQKAAWVLHMLRREVGDQKFHEGIRIYYSRFVNANAMTSDFQQVMEQIAGRPLEKFFQQWLYQPGHPVLKITSRYDQKARSVSLIIEQTQEGIVYELPLDIQVKGARQSESSTVFVNSRTLEVKVPFNGNVFEVVIDPDTWLLFEEQVKAK